MEFCKADLRSGDLVKVFTSNGQGIARVYLGTDNGDIMSGFTWFPLKDYKDEVLFGDVLHNWAKTKILAVYRPKTNQAFKLDEPSDLNHLCLWKRDTTGPARKELRELEGKLNELRKRARELNSIINEG